MTQRHSTFRPHLAEPAVEAFSTAGSLSIFALVHLASAEHISELNESILLTIDQIFY
jgi:hypothetical protein